MYYVYIIKNSNNRHYIGQTNSLGYRIEMHNKNLVKSTRNLGPWEYVITRECSSRSEAMSLELKLKKFKNSKKAIEYLS